MKSLLPARAFLELAGTRDESIEAKPMQCSHELGFHRSKEPLPCLQRPLEQCQQGWRSLHFSHAILELVSMFLKLRSKAGR